jgi:lipoprotein-releasing system permease protein
MPWPVYLAFKHLFPTGRRASFFTVMSVLGVTLGVTVLLAVQSVMNGFSHEYQVNLIRAYGNVIIRANGLIDHPDQVVDAVKTMPGVKSVEPIVLGLVMLQYQNRPAFPAARSIAWPAEFPRTDAEKKDSPHGDTSFPDVYTFDTNRPGASQHPLAQTIVAGSFDDLDDNSVLLSSGLADDLGVSVGAQVDVYTPLMLDALKRNEVILPREFRVAGIFTTGWTMIDDNTIGLTLRTMRQLYGLDDEVSQIEVRLDSDDIGQTVAAAAAIEQRLASLNQQRTPDEALHADTWMDINSGLLKILLVEKTVMFYIMIFIVIVAAFSIASTLVTSVVRKTREIGVLGALGARPGQVAMVFCLQGFIIGLAGTVLGVLLALLLLHYRQNIVDAFVDQSLLIEFYKFLSFPVEFRTGDFVRIIGFTLLITTLAGLLPAWRAARLKPADCLRSE